jgi:hypothetical protein
MDHGRLKFDTVYRRNMTASVATKEPYATVSILIHIPDLDIDFVNGPSPIG